METMIIHPKNKEQWKVGAGIMKVLKIPFEKAKTHKEGSEEKPYDPEFVKKILQGDKDLKEGKGSVITLEELKELCK